MSAGEDQVRDQQDEGRRPHNVPRRKRLAGVDFGEHVRGGWTVAAHRNGHQPHPRHCDAGARSQQQRPPQMSRPQDPRDGDRQGEEREEHRSEDERDHDQSGRPGVGPARHQPLAHRDIQRSRATGSDNGAQDDGEPGHANHRKRGGDGEQLAPGSRTDLALLDDEPLVEIGQPG